MSLDSFAAAVGMGRSTLVRVENGTRDPERHELEAMSRASGLPLGFFLAEDLHTALERDAEPALADRVDQLESQISELRAAVLELAAGNLRLARTQLETAGKDRPSGSGGASQ